MNLPSFTILPCPECAEPLRWLQSDGHPQHVICGHCGGMFDTGLVSGVTFGGSYPRRPGADARSRDEIRIMKQAGERRLMSRKRDQ